MHQQATNQSLSRQNLQQFEELLSIPEINIQVTNSGTDTHQVRVDPLHECLLLHTLSLICQHKWKMTLKLIKYKI